MAEFPGLKVSCDPRVEKFPWVKFLGRDGSHGKGISQNPRLVSWNGNSGAAAINFAVHAGVKRVVLLGFDMKLGVGTQQHWHDIYHRLESNDPKRLMKMPFEQMSLMDYAINSSLVLSNTALLKHDKVGLITFNTSIDSFFTAERRSNTIVKMLELLYKLDTDYAESNYELLFVTIKRMIPHRSLLILYTNFESLTSLSRQLPFLQRLSKSHLVLVILFENTEITRFRKKEAHTLEEIYMQTIADKFIHDKNLMVKELNNHGIMALLTKPDDLSVKLINKYLEMKDRNMI